MNRSLVLCTAASGTSTVVDSSSGATVMNYFSSEDAVLRSSCVAQTALGFMLQHSNKPHMHLYNWAKKQPTTRCAAPEPILCVCSDASNSFVIAGSASGKGYIWSSSTGDLLAQWNAHFRGVSCVAATHDSAFVVTGGDDGLVQVIRFRERPRPALMVFALKSAAKIICNRSFDTSFLAGVECSIGVQRGCRALLLLFGPCHACHGARSIYRRRARPGCNCRR
jgi:WD40 repeat protein